MRLNRPYLLALVATLAVSATASAADVTPAEARAIAKEAYIYGFPLVDSYRIQYAYWIDPTNPEYKAPLNQLVSMARLFTPEDKAVQTPNSDTPYSFFGGDLRAEPIVLTVPEVEKERYYSIQLIDAYTHNFGYIGSRATGSGAASYLVTGPGWKGEKPAGIREVIPCETHLMLGVYRTQLLRPDGTDNVKKIQAGYRMEPLSKFLGQPAPPAAPALDYIKPLTPAEQRTSLEFFNILNFVLTLCPTVPSETGLMERFAKIGIGAGMRVDVAKLAPAVKEAMAQGMADGLKEYEEFSATQIDTGKVASGDMFGDRAFLKNNYLYRMAAAILGIYGNSKAEAMYPIYALDAAGQKLDATKNRYTVRFAPGQFPPVHAFWSLTMYDMPASLLVANPINRYLLNSPMLPQFKKDADGGLTLLVQHESPGADKQSNWLPAPKEPFMMAMRLYWPKEEATSGKWIAPKLTQAE